MKRLLFLLILLILASCQKEELDVDKTYNLQKRSSTAYPIAAAKQAFEFQKSNHESACQNFLDPFSYNIDPDNARTTSINGQCAVIFNVLDTILYSSDWIRTQILVKSTSEEHKDVTCLMYYADSTYYSESEIKPSLFNFTGYVFESNSNWEIETTYKVVSSDVEDVVQAIIVPPSEPDCYDFGSKGGFFSFIANVFNSIVDAIKDFFSNNSPGTGNGASSGNVYGPNFHSADGIDSGGGGGGGGCGPVNIPLCQRFGDFWSNLDLQTRKNYTEALSIVSQNSDLIICTDPFENGPGGCDVTYEDILCGATEMDCFSTGNSSQNDFVDCLTAVFDQLEDLDDACSKSLRSFMDNYDVQFTKSEQDAILDAIPEHICGGEGFDELVGKSLLESKFGVAINNTIIREDKIIGVDASGFIKILHIDSKDPDNLTSQELFDHISEIVHCASLYFCETSI